MSKPYTIRFFMPNGDSASLKLIDKMNWTGKGIEISRDAWPKYRQRDEFGQAGIYILFGYNEENDLPTIYIGQGDGVRSRIDSHEKNKLFWDRALVFISSNHGLNRAHITWLEWALIKKAQSTGRSILDNNATPNEPVLTEFEKADTKEFLNEIYSILPLVDIKVFEEAEKIIISPQADNKESLKNTIVVPAQEDGFKKVFLNENSWYAIRISGGKLKDIKYIAAYQTAPISAITYYAEIESIEPYGDGGKYKLNFKSPAIKIEPIRQDNKKIIAPQAPRYTSFEKLTSAKYMSDVF